jgi:hypothetical protein
LANLFNQQAIIAISRLHYFLPFYWPDIKSRTYEQDLAAAGKQFVVLPDASQQKRPLSSFSSPPWQKRQQVSDTTRSISSWF